MDHPPKKKSSSKERGSYRSFLNNPNVSPSKLPRTSSYRHNKKKKTGQRSDASAASASVNCAVSENIHHYEEMDVNIEDNHVELDDGPNQCSSDVDGEMLKLNSTSGDVETEVKFLDQDAFTYPGNNFLDDWVEENGETGEKDEDDSILLEEILDDQDNLDSVDLPESKISEEPLFEGCPLTLAMHIISIITFAMTEHLSGSTLAHLLTLIWLHCPKPNKCVRNLKQLWGFFKDFNNPIEWHYMCSNCHKYIGKHRPQPSDYCLHCNNVFRMGKFKSWHPFIAFPIVQQLLCFFEDKHFVDQLDYKFKHEVEKQEKGTDENIEDIIDGENFKRFFGKGGFLRNRYHLAFQMNTDGVALFKSSTFSIWPVYLIICDLPPRIRYTRKYRIFAGLWFGYTKPVFSTLCSHLLKQCSNCTVMAFQSRFPWKTIL